jgi:hypothetical protein
MQHKSGIQITHTFQEGAPILTFEACNDIIKGGRSELPILSHTTDQEFFKIKVRRFTQHMQKFVNGNGTYTIGHPIAMAVALALETEQRNRHYEHALNESQKTHVEYIKQTANFTRHITEEATKNISQHIIEKLNSPIEESKKQIEGFTNTVIDKLEEREKSLEGPRDRGHETIACVGIYSPAPERNASPSF